MKKTPSEKHEQSQPVYVPPSREAIPAEELVSFNRGWDDCRTYYGSAVDDPSYVAGFNACVKAYHEALEAGKGWDAVPTSSEAE